MDIVTITLNPALDLTTRLEAMHPGEVNLVSEANLRAAGKDQRRHGLERSRP
jgi:1-phosphofructokinase